MDIKEIALTLGKQFFGEGVSERITDYAEALVAEIQRQSEPIGHFAADQGGIHFALEPDEYHNWLPVFAFPPSIEALEDKVAEACAELLQQKHRNCFGAHSFYLAGSVSIANGEWKKFRKGK